MPQIIFALVFTINIYLSSFGYIEATYILIGLSLLHILFTVFSSIAAIFIVSANKATNAKNNHVTKPFQRFVMHLFIVASTYHLYTLGYVMLTGALIITLSILIATSLMLILSTKET